VRSSRGDTGLAKVHIHDQFVPRPSLGHVTHDHATGCTVLFERMQQLLKLHDLFALRPDPRWLRLIAPMFEADADSQHCLLGASTLAATARSLMCNDKVGFDRERQCDSSDDDFWRYARSGSNHRSGPKRQSLRTPWSGCLENEEDMKSQTLVRSQEKEAAKVRAA